jgi:hypothetical protein
MLTKNLIARFEDTWDPTIRLHHNQNNVDGIEYGAIFDVSGRYRYSLWRAWSPYHTHIVFILLNPSTADEHKNDPTILRCMSFARAWNFGSMDVVNLFAYRATDYRELFNASEPIGAENNRFLMQAVEHASTIVLGWGVRGTFLSRDRQVMSLLAGRNDLHCLGIAKNGQPRHPLYVNGNTSLIQI